MNTETLAIRQVSHAAGTSSGSTRVKPDPYIGRQHQAASPTTGQTRPHSAPRNASLDDGGLKEEPRPPSGSNRTSAGSSVVPIDLYPLSGFLKSVLAQENALWEKNELLLKSLKSKTKL